MKPRAIFRHASVCAGLALASVLVAAAPPDATGAGTFVFVHVNVVPMDREHVLEDQTVVVRAGRIVEMGPAQSTPAPSDATRIDGTDRYLMPGLAEMHGHLPTPRSNLPARWPEDVLFLYVANGVTTVRGMQASERHLWLRDEIERGRVLGPRLQVAAPPLNGRSVETVEDGVRKVRDYQAAGFDLLKIHEGLRPEVYDAIATTAQQVAIPFGGHVPDSVGLRRALEAGQVSIDHLDNMLEVAGSDGERLAEVVTAVRSHGAWVVPTMALWEVFLLAPQPEVLRSERPELRYVPARLRADWARGQALRLRAERDPEHARKQAVLRRRLLLALSDGGVGILLGSDSPQLYSVPGFSLHREMRLMAESGLTPFQVLASGTREVARHLGELESSGTVAVGRRADLILLNANPLQDLAHVADRTGVMVNGRWLPQSRIRERLREVEVAYAPRASGSGEDEWPHYGGDAGGTRHSALDQINRANVDELQVAWVFDTGDFSDGSGYPARSAFEATPLVVDNVLYVSTPFHRLFALDPETGRKLWEFDPEFDRQSRPFLYVSRGVAHWTDSTSRRVLLGDQQGRLFSIDPSTGTPDPAFGRDGMLDLARGVIDGFPDAHYGLTSPVAVCGDVIIAGGWASDDQPRGPSGDVRGYDVRSGELLWRFHTVPRPGEFGHETWSGESWRNRGGVNAWTAMSVDEARGMVFAALGSPSYDWYGGDREGANLFGNSVLALDCLTGRRRWHFQTLHHDIWDYDLPAQPSLVTVQREGAQIPAVAQITKTGFVFLLDRRSGEPLFDVEERPVPRSDVPGEASAPTQPVPLKPPPFARRSMTRDELTDVTPESRAECLKLLDRAGGKSAPLQPFGSQTTLVFPGLYGGASWGGASFDPETGLLFVNSMDLGNVYRLAPTPAGSPLPYQARGGWFRDSKRYPCQKPPWGALTAIDLRDGSFRWRVTLGEFDALREQGIPKTGTPNVGGSIVTAGGLVFIAATNDGRFRAFDKDSGRELWVARLPASGFATPMTYRGRKTGKQFVVVAAGGGGRFSQQFSGKLVAFALP